MSCQIEFIRKGLTTFNTKVVAPRPNLAKRIKAAVNKMRWASSREL